MVRFRSKKPQAFHSYTPIARCAQRLLREKTRRDVGTTRARGFTLAPRRPPASVCLALAFPRGQPSGTAPKLCCVKRSQPWEWTSRTSHQIQACQKVPRWRGLPRQRAKPQSSSARRQASPQVGSWLSILRENQYTSSVRATLSAQCPGCNSPLKSRNLPAIQRQATSLSRFTPTAVRAAASCRRNCSPRYPSKKAKKAHVPKTLGAPRVSLLTAGCFHKR